MIDANTLLEAVDLINKAALQLEIVGTPCEKCGHIHYGKWNEKQMFSELEAMQRKLLKFASRSSK